MASEVWEFTVTIPAGTSATAYQVTNLPMPPRDIQTIEWRIPPGPRGLVGFALGAAGQPTIPYGYGQWIIGDDDRGSWTVTRQIESGAWQCFAYNTGSFPHTIYLRFLTALLNAPTATMTLQPLPVLSGLVDLSTLSEPPLLPLSVLSGEG